MARETEKTPKKTATPAQIIDCLIELGQRGSASTEKTEDGKKILHICIGKKKLSLDPTTLPPVKDGNDGPLKAALKKILSSANKGSSPHSPPFARTTEDMVEDRKITPKVLKECLFDLGKLTRRIEVKDTAQGRQFRVHLTDGRNFVLKTKGTSVVQGGKLNSPKILFNPSPTNEHSPKHWS